MTGWYRSFDAEMDDALRKKLRKLPPLGKTADMSTKCKVCGRQAKLFDVVDFNKHCSSTPYYFGYSGIQVSYFRCSLCQCLFTPLIDDWTQDEVAEYIYNDDYILVDQDYVDRRPRAQAKHISDLLDGRQGLRILDYGSGSGKFARYMHEQGYNLVTSYDPFANPTRPEGLFDLVTAFEVVEHSPRPLDTFCEMKDFLTSDGAILISQTTQPANIDDIRCAWWYAAPRNGHVTTYSDITFAVIAEKLSLRYRRGGGIFAFTTESLSPLLERPAAAIGPKFSARILGSPGPTASVAGRWEGMEELRDKSRFRWSGSDRLEWTNCQIRPGVNRFVVPFVMEVQQGYSNGCVVSIDGVEVATRVVGQTLVADVEASENLTVTLTLKCPAPIRPCDIGGSTDARALGLAIPLLADMP